MTNIYIYSILMQCYTGQPISLSPTVLVFSLAVVGQYPGLFHGGSMLLSVPGMWVGRVEGMQCLDLSQQPVDHHHPRGYCGILHFTLVWCSISQ